MSLKGKVAFVTGSSSGIGRAIMEKLASKGADVVVHGLGDIGPIQAIADEVSTKYNVRSISSNIDLSEPESIQSFSRQLPKLLGHADILVNNAGIQHTAPVQDFPEEKWNAIISVNLSSAFYLTKYLIGEMQKRKWGRIVNISSVHGLVGSVNKVAYVSAKHGIIGMTKVVALENAGKGITVNAVCPGWVETELIKNQYVQLAEENKISIEQAKQDLVSAKQPSGNFLQPADIANMVGYLCSDEAAGVTGSSYTLDGGWTAQ